MAFGEAVRTTFAEIWAHKMRSALTLVGVILGTMGVVVMVTMIDAIKVMVWDGIKGLGFDGVMFVSDSMPEDPADLKKRGLSRGMSVRDVGVLEEGGDTFEAVAAIRITQRVVRARGTGTRVRVYGITPSYGVVHNRQVTAGRWIDPGDQIETRRVAVLGINLAEKLFGTDDPLGRDVQVGDTPFRVVGVESRIGNRFANDDWSEREMDGVLVPLSAFRAYLEGGEELSLLTVKTSDTGELGLVKSEIERLVRRAHHGVNDFEVDNVAEEMVKAEKQVRELLRNWTIVLAAISGISLLVGGVGIYSVMRISLAERVYEIGLRKAIGATDRAILVQFLVEATTLSILGAILGCGLAALIAKFASRAFEAGLPLSPLGLGLGVGFAVAVGLFAGLFPAISAARLTPVEAMRG